MLSWSQQYPNRAWLSADLTEVRSWAESWPVTFFSPVSWHWHHWQGDYWGDVVFTPGNVHNTTLHCLAVALSTLPPALQTTTLTSINVNQNRNKDMLSVPPCKLVGIVWRWHLMLCCCRPDGFLLQFVYRVAVVEIYRVNVYLFFSSLKNGSTWPGWSSCGAVGENYFLAGLEISAGHISCKILIDNLQLVDNNFRSPANSRIFAALWQKTIALPSFLLTSS